MLGELSSPVSEILDSEAFQRFLDGVETRGSGVPIAYITGEREFWSLPFRVGPGVLVPRPETELVVEHALRLLKPRITRSSSTIHIHDCCTGSGVVGIAIASELIGRRCAVTLALSDVSSEALFYARQNAERHLDSAPSVEVIVRESDLLDGASQGLDIVTANPPYLTERAADEVLGKGWNEPRIALAAGSDGMDRYPEIARQAFDHLAPGGALVVECGPEQAQSVLSLFTGSIGYTGGVIVPDAAGRPRVVAGIKPSGH